MTKIKNTIIYSKKITAKIYLADVEERRSELIWQPFFKEKDRNKEEDTDENVTYILKCNDNSLYTGWTNDITHRLKMHNEGKGAKYTRGRGPVELVYLEEFETKQEAMSREAKIKRLTRKEKLLLIETYQQEQKLNLKHQDHMA